VYQKITRTTTHAGVNGSSNGGGGEKRPNGSDAGSMSLTGGGPGSGTASRTGGRSGNGRGSHTTTGGISGVSWGDSSTAGSLCSSVPDANRFLRLYTIAQYNLRKTFTSHNYSVRITRHCSPVVV